MIDGLALGAGFPGRRWHFGIIYFHRSATDSRDRGSYGNWRTGDRYPARSNIAESGTESDRGRPEVFISYAMISAGEASYSFGKTERSNASS
jgi:hypothetical protein